MWIFYALGASFLRESQRFWQNAELRKRILLFLVLSGLVTGASWLCYYRALQEGPASVVVPIDKLSMLVTIAFSWIVFHERLTKKAAVGVLLITDGTVLLARFGYDTCMSGIGGWNAIDKRKK